MIVRFYKRTRDGAERIGDLILRDGVLTAQPADRAELIHLLTEPHEDFNAATGERRLIDPKAEPEAFLTSCLRTFRGSYFWCNKLQASTGTESAEPHRDTQKD